MADRILTPAELAEMLRVSPATVDSLRADGLPAIELPGGVRRFLLSETLAWLRSRLVPQPAASGLETLIRRREELREAVDAERAAWKRGAR